MRKWIIAGVVLLVLVVIAGVALLNLNSLIQRNKGYLIAQAEEALGRNVTVEEIGVSLWGGVGARLQEFTIADDPTFSKEPFVRAANLQVNLRFTPLLRRELEISRLVLNRPVINVIRDEKGRFNFATLGREKEKKVEKERDPAERPEPRPLMIALVDINDGQVRYFDKAEGIDFQASRVNLEIREIASDRPVEFSFQAAVFGADRRNFRADGRVGPLGQKTDPAGLPIEATIDLQPVPVADIQKTLPGFQKRLPDGLELAGAIGTTARVSGRVAQNGLPGIEGELILSKVSARVPQLPQPITDVNTKIRFTGKTAELPETPVRIGSSQIRLAATVSSFTPLNLAYRLSSPELRLADLRAAAAQRKKPEVLRELTSQGTASMRNGALAYRGDVASSGGTVADADYTNLKSTVAFANSVATIESLSLEAFAGSLKATGRYDMRASTPRFAADANVNAMDLTQIFNSFAPAAPQNLRGRINASLDVTGSGQEWNVIEKALKGTGKAEVVDGALLDVNLAESVLGGATGLPGVVTLIPADIRKKYPQIFEAKDTEFKELKGSAVIGDGRARTDDLVVSAAEFETQAKGWFAFDQTVDFRAVLLLSERLSQDIIARAREIKALANPQGRIEIPFTLSGKLPGAKPKPDVGYIVRAMQKGAIERGLESLFRRQAPKESTETAPMQEEAPRERKRRSPQEEILRGLEKFLGR